MFQSSTSCIYGKERKDQLATKQVPILKKKPKTNKRRWGREHRTLIESGLFDKHGPCVAFTDKFNESCSIHVGWKIQTKRVKVSLTNIPPGPSMRAGEQDSQMQNSFSAGQDLKA